MDILDQFGIKPIFLAAQVVNFFILLFILKKFLYKPLLKVLETRKKTIEQGLKNAEEIEKRLLETHEQSEKIIAKTLQESQKILDETNQTAAQIIEHANKTAEQILNRTVEDSKKYIETQQVALINQVKDNLSGIILIGLEKVLGKKVTREQRKIVGETLKENNENKKTN